MSVVIPNQAKVHRWTVWFLARQLTNKLNIKSYVLSGSYRRGKWWCNDIDLLVPIESESEGNGIIARLYQLGWKYTPYRRTSENVFSHQFMKKMGDKYLVLDLFLALPGTWGNALLFTTGSKYFNDNIRENLDKAGYSWRNPRYFTHLKSDTMCSFATEKAALDFLGMPWVKPKD